VLIRHTLAYLPAQLLSPLLQFATAIVLTHALGAADYGLTMLIFASQELVFLVCLSWWTTFALRYGARFEAQGSAHLLASAAGAVVLLSSVAQVAGTVAIIAVTEPSVPWHFYAVACLFTVTRSSLGFLSERARGQAAIGAYSLVQIAAPLGGLALTLLGMRMGLSTPTQVLGVFGLSQAVIGFAVAAKMGLLTRPVVPDREMLRAALSFGAPVALSNFLCWIGGNGIRFVVLHGAGAVALGLMSLGWGLATRLASVAAMTVSAAAYPLAIQAMEAGDSPGAKRQLSNNSALLLALLAPAAAGMWGLAQPFVELLVAPEYHAMTLAVLPWALLGACIRNLRTHGWDQLYLLCEAPRAMVVLDAAEALLTVLAAVIGLWWAGVPGAVIGCAVAAALIAVGDWAYLRRRFGLQAPLGVYFRILCASGAMYAGLAMLAHMGWQAGAQVLELAAAAMLGTLIYSLALLLLFPAQALRAGRWVLQRARQQQPESHPL